MMVQASCHDTARHRHNIMKQAITESAEAIQTPLCHRAAGNASRRKPQFHLGCTPSIEHIVPIGPCTSILRISRSPVIVENRNMV